MGMIVFYMFRVLVINRLIIKEFSMTEAVARWYFIKKNVLKDFTKFTGKHLCLSHFFTKVAGLRRLKHWCFPVNFAKIFKNTFHRVPSMVASVMTASDLNCLIVSYTCNK